MPSRCPWCEGTFDDYIIYHDNEWGVPVHDDNTHFEFLILECAQAGLSWSTILKKRAGYRAAFAHFNPEEVAAFDEDKIAQLLENPAIVRNELKVRSAVTNARLFLDIQKEYDSFSTYIWEFVDGQTVQNSFASMEEVPAQTAVSRQLSNDLKDRGFKFTGPTVMYAHMQATGLVNDHITSCFRHDEIRTMS